MRIELGRGMKFNDEKLNNIFDWFLKDIVSKVWFEPMFQSCAKGGSWQNRPEFEEKKDMPYLAHIISGASMILRIIDIARSEGKLTEMDDLEIRLKRGLIGFLFHDFNKLVNSSYKMDDPNVLNSIIESLNFDIILNQFGLNKEQLYNLVVSTEMGTRFNSLGRYQDPHYRLEKQLIKWADVLSSVFNEFNPRLKEDIIIGDFILYRNRIKSVRFRNSIYYALTDLIKIDLIDALKERGMKYLWSTESVIYYYSPDESSYDLSTIIDSISKMAVDTYLELVKDEIHRGIKFTDRKIENPAKRIIKLDKAVVENFIKDDDSFESVIRPINSSVDSKFKNNLIEYKKAIDSLKSVYMDLKENNGKFMLNEMVSLNKNAYEDTEILEERKKLFIVRTIQIEFNNIDKLKKKGYKNIEQILRRLNEFVEINDSLLSSFKSSYKGKVEMLKSPFLTLLFVAKERVDNETFDRCLEEILDSWNYGALDLNQKIPNLIKFILGISNLNLEEVPDKSEMAIVSGYKATMRGLGENTFGIKTNQSFTNKIITSKIPNFKIDDNYATEALLRKYLVLNKRKDYSGNLLYLVFPGAISYLNIGDLISAQAAIGSGFSTSFIRHLDISLDPSSSRRYDNSYFIDIGEIDSTERAIDALQTSINFIKLTKLKCLITDSHSPPIENQMEIFRMETKKFIIGDLKWDRIRCNKLDDVLNFINLFRFIAGDDRKRKNGELKVSEVIIDYLRDPLSLFFHIKRNHMNDERSEKKLFGGKNYEVYEDIKKLILYSNIHAPKEVNEKMKDIEKLADIAFDLLGPKFPKSTNERTWIFRDSLDALEKVVASMGDKTIDFEEYYDIVSGQILAGLKRENEVNINIQKVEEFAMTLINMIKATYGGKIPAGILKSYIIDAFEFDLMKRYYGINKNYGGGA